MDRVVCPRPQSNGENNNFNLYFVLILTAYLGVRILKERENWLSLQLKYVPMENSKKLYIFALFFVSLLYVSCKGSGFASGNSKRCGCVTHKGLVGY